jgi:hypothetical protein
MRFMHIGQWARPAPLLDAPQRPVLGIQAIVRQKYHKIFLDII